MTEQGLTAIETRRQLAWDELVRLCKNPRSFTMSIPVQENYDSDRLLAHSLDDVTALVAAVRELKRGERMALQEASEDARHWYDVAKQRAAKIAELEGKLAALGAA